MHENGHDCKEGECKYEISAPFGTIFSPNYPDSYPPNADCVWHFITTPGHRIKLIFNEFDVESHQVSHFKIYILREKWDISKKYTDLIKLFYAFT